MQRAPLLVPAIVVVLVLACAHPRAPTLEREQPTVRYSAVAIGDAHPDDDGRTATLVAIDGVGTVRVNLAGPIVPGERIVLRGRLEPFDEPRNPGEPSQRAIEAADGVVARLAEARILGRNGLDPWDVRAWAARVRALLSARVRSAVPEPSATTLAGALWGERGTLPDDLHDAFQATGTVHVLVTAGLHFGIVAGLLTALLGSLGLHRAVACAAIFVLLVAYTWLTGGHLPAERACAMAGVALLARACGARITSWNTLAFAALTIALVWPTDVSSASFALSFSCVGAIVLFAEPLTRALEASRLPERVREAVALTCATQLGTWPLSAGIFGLVAPYAVLANALVVPLIAIALPLGMLALALPSTAPLVTGVAIAIERVVRTIAALPGAQLFATPPPWAVVTYDAAAIGAAVLWRRGQRSGALAALTVGFACVVLPLVVHAPHGLTITQLDVGQGDAAVIRTPHDHVILIDTGGELEHGNEPTSSAERAGKRIVLGYLRRNGIRKIDLMILTHPHGDHVGGAAPIVNAMPVGMIFDSGQAYNGRAYRDAMEAVHVHRVPVVLARRGMRWASGDGVTINILAPSIPFLADTGDDVNENSVVALLEYRGFRELFMGDAGEASERKLLESSIDLRADAVKVGHHGSRYASTPAFVAIVRPRIAIISVGRHNTFGHPAPTTIDAWDHAGADILRTDQCGAISLAGGSPTTMLRCTAR
jgi:competence protein ComEC